MKRARWALLACCALLAAACGPVGGRDAGGSAGPPQSGALRDGGTLTVALSDDPDLLDPTLARTLVGRIVFASFCEKLYDIDANLNVVPQLAAALPALSSGGRVAEIKLREGITFNDGTPLDAEAVKTSLDRHRELEGSQRRSELLAVSEVEVVDPLTVRIRLSEPFAPLAAVLADRAGMIMSPSQLEQLGEDFSDEPVCVGPFSFVERVAQDRIVLERSEHYYARDRVHLDRIVYRPITDDSIRLANLRSGDVQVVDQVQPTDVPSAQQDASLQLIATSSLGYQGITINVANANGLPPAPPGEVPGPLANDARVRQAFELSLDREALNRVVFGGLYEPTCSPIPLTSPYATPALAKCPPHDVDEAKRLLAEAGVTPPVPVELITDTSPLATRIGQTIQSMAREAGFEVRLRPTEFATALDETDAGNFQAFAVGWSGRVDPDGNIANFHLSEGSQNISRASDEEVDELILQARATTDTEQRRQLYEQVVKAIHERDNIIYLYRIKTFVGVSRQVGGVAVYPDSLPRVAFAGYAAG